MQMTVVLVELVIIGGEVSAWLFVLFSLHSGFLTLLERAFEFDGAIIIFACFCYVLGIAFDRIVDHATDCYEKKCKSIKGIPDDVVAEFVLKDAGIADGYYGSMSSRKRIMRATFFNALIACAVLGIAAIKHLVFKNHSMALLFVLLMVGTGTLAFISFFAARKIIMGFYGKVKKAYDRCEKKKTAKE